MRDHSASGTYLYVIALVVITALTEQSVMNNVVDVKLVKEWVAVLSKLVHLLDFGRFSRHTFETEAVKTTTSYNSPTLFIN